MNLLLVRAFDGASLRTCSYNIVFPGIWDCVFLPLAAGLQPFLPSLVAIGCNAKQGLRVGCSKFNVTCIMGRYCRSESTRGSVDIS